MTTRHLASGLTLLALAACGGSSPTTPTPPPPPPVVVNTPPTVSDVTASAARIEAGDTLNVSATVADTETPLDKLKYDWTASPANGTFNASGASGTWQAPAGEHSPDLYTLKLTVTEDYTSAGQPQHNVVSGTTTVHYNDSRAEVGGIATQFLTDFWTFSVSPEACVRNFADSCSGKQDELHDIRDNRSDFHIIGGSFTVSGFSADAAHTSSTVSGPCSFEDTKNSTGRHEIVSGTCVMTAVYQNWQWYLCTSHFVNASVTSASLRGRVPGQISSSYLRQP